MRSTRTAISLLLLGTVVSACGTGSLRNKIEGNNTGGVIPPALISGGNAQALASAHCAKWNATARITFSGAEAGGDTVFVCETGVGPAMMGVPAANTGPQNPRQPAAKR
jgi:hypothetical protein